MRDEYRTEYAQSTVGILFYRIFLLTPVTEWNSTATRVDRADMVDVILCPASPGVASLIGTSRYWCYTSQWNLLDYPALAFPVSVVDLERDVRDDAYVPMNEQDAYNHGLCK